MKAGAKGRLRSAIGAWCVAAALAGALPAVAGDNPEDPYEGFNRAMFAVNEGLDKVITKPLAQAYDTVTPLPARAGIGSFFDNILELRNALNSLLQGKVADAASDLGRLAINTTVGIFGLFDVASEIGLERHEEDFGQTLAVWGYRDSAYLYWPLLGPRTVRDTGGFVVDAYTDPTWGTVYKSVSARNSLIGLRVVDTRADLLPVDSVVEEAALDKYAYVRDAYLQRRRNLIFDGRPPRLDDDY
jgi:phospholipid-binding lipoprotein MlaA